MINDTQNQTDLPKPRSRIWMGVQAIQQGIGVMVMATAIVAGGWRIFSKERTVLQMAKDI